MTKSLIKYLEDKINRKNEDIFEWYVNVVRPMSERKVIMECITCKEEFETGYFVTMKFCSILCSMKQRCESCDFELADSNSNLCEWCLVEVQDSGKIAN